MKDNVFWNQLILAANYYKFDDSEVKALDFS